MDNLGGPLPERTEEFELGAETICLAGKDQMVVARSVRVRGVWGASGELCSVQLELRCEEDQLLSLQQLRVIPQTLPLDKGSAVRLFFEMESNRVSENVLSELGDAQRVGELFLAEDRFPPILNLMHYSLRDFEIDALT